MNNPKVMAVVSAAVAAWLVYDMATATESPSTTLAALQYVFLVLALISLFGAIWQMMKAQN